MTEREANEDAKVRSRAQSDLNDIAKLRESPAFTRYFQRRLNEIRDDLARDVLEGKMPPQERDLKQREYQLAKRIATLLDADEGANRNVVSG